MPAQPASPTQRANLFGDVRAELDHDMLSRSFHQSQNYLTLFEGGDRFIVVGRRGTGKSALTYRLANDWRQRRALILVVAPDEEDVIGLRPLARLFGNSFNRIRAGIKLAWRYAVLLEIGQLLHEHYKSQSQIDSRTVLLGHLRTWKTKGLTPIERMRTILREMLKGIDDPEERVGELPRLLQLNRITEDVVQVVRNQSRPIVLLVDRLDEGYEPDATGLGIIDGLLYGTDDLRNGLGNDFRAVVFLRDNIFRAIQLEDKDFTRNLEGLVLRLHWDPIELFYMLTKRIRAALSVNKESDVKVWNEITSNELHGNDGFKQFLKLTLYRPRDAISLLNAAYFQARKSKRDTLIQADLQHSAKQISEARLDDLGKEYESVFPGIGRLTTAFANGPTRLAAHQAVERVRAVWHDPALQADELQHFRILGSEEEILKALYGVGFLGVQDTQYSTWVFSHDGKRPDKSISSSDALLVHPCYWAALNLSAEELEQSAAEQIYDEYEIKILSQSAEQRSKRLGQLISELHSIKPGLDNAEEFADWCKRAIEISFAKELTNVQIRPNAGASQRRDIVATNQGIGGFWKRVREDYGSRQVVFEIKNYEEVGVEEYRQVSSYLVKEYGKFGFIVCRDAQAGLRKGRELEAFREFYAQHGQVIVKINATMLVGILSKLRSPAKLEAGDIALGKHLDTHIRLYASGQSEPVSRRKTKAK